MQILLSQEAYEALHLVRAEAEEVEAALEIRVVEAQAPVPLPPEGALAAKVLPAAFRLAPQGLAWE